MKIKFLVFTMALTSLAAHAAKPRSAPASAPSTFKLFETRTYTTEGITPCADSQERNLPSNWVGTYTGQTETKDGNFYDSSTQRYIHYSEYNTVRVVVGPHGIRNVAYQNFVSGIPISTPTEGLNTRQSAQTIHEANVRSHTKERYCFKDELSGNRLSLTFVYSSETAHLTHEAHLRFNNSAPLLDLKDVGSESPRSGVAKVGLAAYKSILYGPIGWTMRWDAYSQSSTKYIRRLPLTRVP